MTRKNVCGAHKRAKPCPSCAKSAAKHRLLWQTEERRTKHHESTRHLEQAWQTDEIAMLREHASRECTSDITNRINAWRADFGLTPRTRYAVVKAMHANGIDASWRPPRSTTELMPIFGVARQTIRAWLRLGLLQGQPWGMFTVHTDEHLETFIREHSWAVDGDRITDRRLRDLYAVVTKRDPWLTRDEFAKLVGCAAWTVSRYIQAGKIRAYRRPGSPGALMLRSSEAGQMRQLVAEQKALTVTRLGDRRRRLKVAA